MARRREEEDEDEDEALESVERVFEGREVPGWREQVTLRALAVSALLGAMFSVIVMKLNLTTGIIPSLNISAGLLGFFFVRLWTAAIERVGLLRQPFTRQENTVIQTCVVASYGLAFSGNQQPISNLGIYYHFTAVRVHLHACFYSDSCDFVYRRLQRQK